jgi:hypothetical protein
MKLNKASSGIWNQMVLCLQICLSISTNSERVFVASKICIMSLYEVSRASFADCGSKYPNGRKTSTFLVTSSQQP